MEDLRIQRDPLYVACTRPAMRWGVPVEGFALNFAGCYLAFLWVAHANLVSVRGVAILAAGPIVHMAMRVAASIDHNCFRILRLYIETTGVKLRGVSLLWSMPWYGNRREGGSSAVR